MKLTNLLLTVAGTLLVTVSVSRVDATPPTSGEAIEQELATIRVGVDTRASIRSRFGPLQDDRRQNYVRVGNGCELRFAFSDADDKRIKPHATLTAIVLQRLAANTSDAKCDALATGQGLRFGDALGRVERVYGRPAIRLDEGDIVFFRYHNYSECGDDRRKTIHAKDLMVRWNRSTRKIVELSVQGNPTSCDLILAE
jgi:hypothetical protein